MAGRVYTRKALRERLAALCQLDDATGCLEFVGGKRGKGYGCFTVSTGRTEGAHRVAWELENGPIPMGLHVLHRCDNRPCCNPEHLFLGTNRDNIADMIAKGRDRKVQGVESPHAKLTPAAVRSIRVDGRSYKSIGREYGVSAQTVFRIKRHTVWKSV